jgi:RimJ/RimL family protein N-acetyltransferase
MRDYAFGKLALLRLVSLILKGNVASRRVAEKIGMHLEREMGRYGRRYWLYALYAIGQ